MKQEGVEEENLQDRNLEAPHSFSQMPWISLLPTQWHNKLL